MEINLKLLDQDRKPIEEHLRRSYFGVFTEREVQSHISSHVEGAFAEEAIKLIAPHVKDGTRLLDIGSGFGSFVLKCRMEGIDARGIEIEDFEINFARRRLESFSGNIRTEEIFVCKSFLDQSIPSESHDLVTLWNVVEHIEDLEKTLEIVERILVSGGRAFLICPNYKSWGVEAHYRVKWNPKLGQSKKAAVKYLKSLSLDPKFLEENIFFRTNKDVRRVARGVGLIPWPMGTPYPGSNWFKIFQVISQRPLVFLKHIFPYKPTIAIELIKP